MEQSKSDLIINKLATNFGLKLAQIEGEKAILEVEVQMLTQELNEVRQKLEEAGKEDENVKN